jgi:hypothetical protein
MIAVIFEVWPASGERETYLDIAGQLRPLLDDIDGFISIERFASLTDPERSFRCPSGVTKTPSRSGAIWKRIVLRRRGDAAMYSAITACALPRSCAITA